MPFTDTECSKHLSFLLRHGAELKKLPITPEGYVAVNDILNLSDFQSHKIQLSDIQRIVTTYEKQNFQLKKDGNEWFIRVYQNHPIIPVGQNHIIKLINDPHLYSHVVHGTYFKSWEHNIKIEGLKVMSKNLICFGCGYPNVEVAETIPGIKKNCDMFIEIDLEKAMKDGIKFYISNNKIIFTEGLNGILSPKYFKKVMTKGLRSACGGRCRLPALFPLKK